MDPSALPSGQTRCDIKLHLATGRQGGPKVSQRTIARVLRSIADSGDPEFTFEVLGSSWLSFLLPRQKYFSLTLRPSRFTGIGEHGSITLRREE